MLAGASGGERRSARREARGQNVPPPTLLPPVPLPGSRDQGKEGYDDAAASQKPTKEKRVISVPTNILLTGAGFTKNFGGLLASEVWGRLFDDAAVRSIPGLAKRVSEYAPDFERAYQELVRPDPSSSAARALHSAVAEAYNEIDQNLRAPIPGNIDTHGTGLAALVKCCTPAENAEVGFLFTLNQDLFPERRTFGKEHFGFPEVLAVPAASGSHGSYFENRDNVPLHGKDIKRCPNETTIAERKKDWVQPGGLYWVKLHGSYNWRSADDRDVMVLGHDKSGQIASEPLLSWYWSLFREVLGSARHRLVVIGYSFRDPHVNEVIAGSIKDHGTELVVINPTSWVPLEGQLNGNTSCHGPEIAKQLASGSGSRYYPNTLVDFFPRLDGSTTPLWDKLKKVLASPLE
jgi:hypothetical protein